MTQEELYKVAYDQAFEGICKEAEIRESLIKGIASKQNQILADQAIDFTKFLDKGRKRVVGGKKDPGTGWIDYNSKTKNVRPESDYYIPKEQSDIPDFVRAQFKRKRKAPVQPTTQFQAPTGSWTPPGGHIPVSPAVAPQVQAKAQYQASQAINPTVHTGPVPPIQPQQAATPQYQMVATGKRGYTENAPTVIPQQSPLGDKTDGFIKRYWKQLAAGGALLTAGGAGVGVAASKPKKQEFSY